MAALERPSSRRASLSVVRTAEDVSHARVTSSDHAALQFYWQGFDTYVHCKSAREDVAPCFFNAHCVGAADDGEFVYIVPVEEVRERSILDEMRVQLVSVSSGRYLRATRVSKFLRWSSARDEQTVFQIQVLDRKPLTQGAKFTLASCFWPGYYVGFGQKVPLGGSRDLAKAIGFLTLEKKKHQPPLLFPIRFRAVLREFRDLRPATSPSHQEPQLQAQHVPTAVVTPSDMDFIDVAEDDNDANARSDDLFLDDIPLATVVTSSPVHQLQLLHEGNPEDDPAATVGGDSCPYCSVVFRLRAGLLAHIRDYHGDWVQRPSVAGSFCVHCGQRRMTNTENTTASPSAPAAAAPVLGKSGKKICCSCPETKSARDLCLVNNGEDLCKELIEKHKACLRSEGFVVK
ncbi:hypothetical protein PybrP1_004688 [[Pythium] brassicae (nom. inval.)]|nr:hypothetical protein PybrP1_004688 [[Pythium] brassicae (nom. inval.)]